MANPKVKCPVCGATNNKLEAIKLGRRYYCVDCAEGRDENTQTDWDVLFQYICWLYQIPTLTGAMFKQLKEYREVWGYTDLGMYHTLRYYHEVLGKPVKEDSNLGIIIYYYDRAKVHMIQRYEISQKLEQFVHEEEVIEVQTTQVEKWNKKKELDFSTVDWGVTNED